LGQADQMAELEDGSIDFYSMLRSVVDQKRQAELDEALQTSGWTAHYPANSNGAAGTGPILASGATIPKEEQEIMANTFQSPNE
jgi:phospholipid-binding lipoprotein MlaA